MRPRARARGGARGARAAHPLRERPRRCSCWLSTAAGVRPRRSTSIEPRAPLVDDLGLDPGQRCRSSSKPSCATTPRSTVATTRRWRRAVGRSSSRRSTWWRRRARVARRAVGPAPTAGDHRRQAAGGRVHSGWPPPSSASSARTSQRAGRARAAAFTSSHRVPISQGRTRAGCRAPHRRRAGPAARGRTTAEPARRRTVRRRRPRGWRGGPGPVMVAFTGAEHDWAAWSSERGWHALTISRSFLPDPRPGRPPRREPPARERLARRATGTRRRRRAAPGRADAAVPRRRWAGRRSRRRRTHRSLAPEGLGRPERRSRPPAIRRSSS